MSATRNCTSQETVSSGTGDWRHPDRHVRKVPSGLQRAYDDLYPGCVCNDCARTSGLANWKTTELYRVLCQTVHGEYALWLIGLVVSRTRFVDRPNGLPPQVERTSRQPHQPIELLFPASQPLPPTPREDATLAALEALARLLPTTRQGQGRDTRLDSLTEGTLALLGLADAIGALTVIPPTDPEPTP